MQTTTCFIFYAYFIWYIAYLCVHICIICICWLWLQKWFLRFVGLGIYISICIEQIALVFLIVFKAGCSHNKCTFDALWVSMCARLNITQVTDDNDDDVDDGDDDYDDGDQKILKCIVCTMRSGTITACIFTIYVTWHNIW